MSSFSPTLRLHIYVLMSLLLGLRSCVVGWLFVLCCMLERRTVGPSSGMMSLLEEVQRLKDEGAELSLDEQDELPDFDLSKLSEAELQMLMEEHGQSERNLDD